MKNEISYIIPDDVFNETIGSTDSIESKLTILKNLPQDGKKGGFRLGDVNLGLYEKGKDYIIQRPNFMPSHTSADETIKDAELAGQLTTIGRRLEILADKIMDTAGIAGMEALAGIMSYYNSVKQAVRENVPEAVTIYNDLKSRFPGRPKKEVA